MSWTMTVVGVAPPGLDYPRGVEYWLASEYGSLDVVARLAPNVTPEAARQEFQTFLEHDPDQLRYIGASSVGAQVHTLTEMVMGDARPALLALTAAVALLLVLACTNVGNLLLLRAAARVREIAIRRAIGASMGDLVRQLLTESILVAFVGGTLGVALARALLDALVRLAPSVLPRTDLIVLAGMPLVVGALVTGVTVILFGVVPSFAAVRFDLSSPLRSDARSGTEGRRLRGVRQTLVASQIALAVVVLAGAGLLVRNLARLTLGATPSGVRNMVMRRALMVAIAGTVVGLAGALAGSRLLTSMLFEITPSDPITLGGVSVLLLVIAAGAAYIPARRATRIDPASALRAE